MRPLAALRFRSQSEEQEYAAVEARRIRDWKAERPLNDFIAKLHRADPTGGMMGCNHVFPPGQFNCFHCGKAALTEL